MSTEEVFIVHTTLQAYNLNYDDLENPKISMVEALSKAHTTTIEKSVISQILDIPNDLFRRQTINFLYNCFLKHDNSFPGEAYSYKELKTEEVYYYFINDPVFAAYLVNCYYKYITNNRVKNNVIIDEYIPENKQNNNLYGSSESGVISINTKLKQDIEIVVNDFLKNHIPLGDIFSLLKNIIIDGYTFQSAGAIKCTDELYELYSYRNYLTGLMISEVYEDVLYAEEAMGGNVESPLYRIDDPTEEEDFDYDFEMNNFEQDPNEPVDEDEDADFEEFNEIIKLLAQNKGLHIYLPDEFYEDLISEYFYIITDEDRHKSNRNNMLKSREKQRILKRINPLYIFDNM